jgi:hypothetical protein
MEHFLQKTQRNLPIKAIRMSMIVFMLPFLAYNPFIKLVEWQWQSWGDLSWERYGFTIVLVIVKVTMQQTISLASGEFRVRPKKKQDPDQKMPVQSLLDRQHNTRGHHHHRHPSNGGGVAPFWTTSK